MRKIAAALLALVLALSLSACAIRLPIRLPKPIPTPMPTSTPAPTPTPMPTPVSTPEPEPEPSAEPEPDEEEEPEPESWHHYDNEAEANEFVLTNGLHPGMSYAEVEEIMGKPDWAQVQVEPEAGIAGVARYVLFYGGDILTMHADMVDGEEPGYEAAELSTIQLRTSAAATARGVLVGDDFESVCEAYELDPETVAASDGICAEMLWLYGTSGNGYGYYDTVIDFSFSYDEPWGYVIFFMFNEGTVTGIMIRNQWTNDWPESIFPPPYNADTASKAGALIPYDKSAPMPELDFEPESVWSRYAERVMLLLSEENDGKISGALYDGRNIKDDPPKSPHTLDALAGSEARSVSFTAQKGEDGIFYDKVSGVSLQIDGDHASVGWAGTYVYLSKRYTLDDAPVYWSKMPLFPEELSAPLPLNGTVAELKEAYGAALAIGARRQYFEVNRNDVHIFGTVYTSAAGEEMYRVFSYSSRANGEHHISVRGIEIGDSALDIAARFPNRYRLPDLPTEEGEELKTLYGREDADGWFGTVSYAKDGTVAQMIYSAGEQFIKLDFDKKGCLKEIAWYMSR